MIRKFIIRSLVFASCVIASIMIAWLIVTYNRSELCKTDAHILFLGNSRIQYGINDRIIPGSLNVGLNADNYNFMYFKLKLLKKYNPQIDTVVITYDKHSLFSYFDISDEKLHPYYWDILDTDDYMFFAMNDKKILNAPLQWLKIIYPTLSLVKEVSFKELGIGGYDHLYRDKLQEAIQRYSHSDESHIIHPAQDKYLKKIYNYCHLKGIKLIFLSMPSHPITCNQEVESFIDQYTQSNYIDIPHWDYEYISLPDSCYGDLTHLNYRGAQVMSEKLFIDHFSE